MAKFESGMCATGRMMKIWKKRLIDNCPRCGAANETSTHILQCSSVDAKTTWEKSMQQLEEWMNTNSTCPHIKRLIIQTLNQWRKRERISGLKDFDFDGIESVFASKQYIGWRQFLGVCVSMEWAKLQHSYLRLIWVRRAG